MADLLGDTEKDRLVAKEQQKKKAIEAKEQKKKKAEDKGKKDKKYWLEGLQSCTVLIGSILANGIDHAKTLAVKELKTLLCYQFKSDAY